MIIIKIKKRRIKKINKRKKNNKKLKMRNKNKKIFWVMFTKNYIIPRRNYNKEFFRIICQSSRLAQQQ